MALNINGTTGISGVDGSVSAPALTGTDSNTGITFPAADTIKFSTGGVERMAITNSGITGIPSGITALNVWYMTTNFTGNASPVVNWAKYDLDYNTAGFGSDMTESSGIWTFPSTGFWEIHCQAYFYGGGSAGGGAGSVAMSAVFSTDGGSSYDTSGNRRSYSNVPSTSGYWYSQNINIHYFDVTDTSTHKMYLRVEGAPPHVDSGGTMVRFIRLADT